MLNESLLFTSEWPEILTRLGTATLAGMVLGLGREVGDHPAGVRTHGIIALSAALITLSAIFLSAQLDAGRQSMDVLRVFEGMATAAGIIAAGLIIFKSGDVRNLTTAAHIWLTAAIGIACGAGQYALVAIAAGLGLFVMIAIKWLEHALASKD